MSDGGSGLGASAAELLARLSGGGGGSEYAAAAQLQSYAMAAAASSHPYGAHYGASPYSALFNNPFAATTFSHQPNYLLPFHNAAAPHQPTSSVDTTESFDEILKKMPQAPKNKAENQPGEEASTSTGINSNGPALAVAIDTKTSKASPTTVIPASPSLSPPKSSRPKTETPSPAPSKRRGSSMASPLPAPKKPKEEARSAGGVEMDPRLLNASALAWANFSNQLLIGLSMHNNLVNQNRLTSPKPKATPARRSGSSRKPKGEVKTEEEDRVAESSDGEGEGRLCIADGKDSVDTTIESVIRRAAAMDEAATKQLSLELAKSHFAEPTGSPGSLSPGFAGAKRASPKPSRSRSRAAGRAAPSMVTSGGGGGLTVREQLVRKRRGGPDEPETPLDLSTKVGGPATTPLCDASAISQWAATTNHLLTPTEDSETEDAPPTPNSRKSPDLNLIRIPVALGWRRQTVIRGISSSGVRGDVFYFSPCGRKLASQNEVLRYLSKHPCEGIKRDHFSFQSKILVGEFVSIDVAKGGPENGLKVLSEKEVAEMIEQCCEEKSRRKAAKSDETQSAASTSMLADAMAEVLRMAREQEEQKHQLATLLLQKQSEEYYRVLLGRLGMEQSAWAAAAEVERTKASRSRQPCDDLRLSDPVPLPTLSRLPLRLSSNAFADILMVYEFVHNFAHVLKIHLADDLPPIDDLHKGLLNQAGHVKPLKELCRILLTLVLEYPGLPPGPNSKTTSGQHIKDLKPTRENEGELLRMWLTTRGHDAAKLADGLDTGPFESLEPDAKAGILALMCNELLYCRNVVREIEGNQEDVLRLRGDRWAKEGKLRLLRGMHARKRLEEERSKTKSSRASSSVRDEDSRGGMKTEASRDASPFLNGAVNGNGAPDAEEESSEAAEKKEEKSRVMVPGIGQVEAVTEEEKAMTAAELDGAITALSADMDGIKDRIKERYNRVRVQPLGDDRYHRLYWDLSSTGALLVQGPDSATLGNPAANIRPHQMRDEEDAAAHDCVQGLLDHVTNTPKRIKPEHELKPIPPEFQKGWWQIRSEDEVKEVLTSLHSRGIRERCLQRSLSKIPEAQPSIFDTSPHKLIVSPLEADSGLSRAAVVRASLHSLLRQLRDMEAKVAQANVHQRDWKPAETGVGMEAGLSSPGSSDSDSDDSESQPLHPPKPKPKRPPPQTHSDNNTFFDELKQRLLNLETSIERRYFNYPFQYAYSVSVPEKAEDGVKRSESEEAEAVGDEGVTAALEKWRLATAAAATPAQLLLCLHHLDSVVAWEKSIMRARCQICRGEEHEEALLLCDSCDCGYHTYCFRPALRTIPDGDWFCPACISASSEKPLCLICAADNPTPSLHCSDCGRDFHPACLDIPTSSTLISLATNGGCPAPSEADLGSKKSRNPAPAAPTAASWLCAACSQKAGPKHWKAAAAAHVPNAHEAKAELRRLEATTATTTTTTTTTMNGEESLSAWESRSSSTPTPTPPTKKGKKEAAESELAGQLVAELEGAEEAWPFRTPVDLKAFPLYRKVIKRPMDLSIVAARLAARKYGHLPTLKDDIDLMFHNCRVFNEDDSPVGKAGFALQKFFNRRYKSLCKKTKAGGEGGSRSPSAASSLAPSPNPSNTSS